MGPMAEGPAGRGFRESLLRQLPEGIQPSVDLGCNIVWIDSTYLSLQYKIESSGMIISFSHIALNQ